jgi:hypothetical protein
MNESENKTNKNCRWNACRRCVGVEWIVWAMQKKKKKKECDGTLEGFIE